MSTTSVRYMAPIPNQGTGVGFITPGTHGLSAFQAHESS
jgi:hypothetical protein